MNEARQKSRIQKIGIYILFFIALMAIFAPLISPYDPFEYGKAYLPPSSEHFLGTNDMGQDIFSEIIYGSRVSLAVGIFSSLVITVVGSSLGMLSGYYRGKVDSVISVLINITMCVPSLPLTILIAAYMGSGLKNLIIAISITAWTGTARIVRTKTLELREMPFVQIEKNLGVKGFLILFRHLLPNLKDILLMRSSLSVASAMLSEAGLSFLGLGLLSQKSWGSILHYAFFRSGVINGYWWWVFPPIIMISVTIMGFVFIGYYGGHKPKNQIKESAVRCLKLKTSV